MPPEICCRRYICRRTYKMRINMAEYKSKHGIVSKNNMELYMAFSDLRNLVMMLPEDKKKDIKADFDRIEATVQGFTVAVKVTKRLPYTLVEISDDNAPFHFSATLNFMPAGNSGKTDFSIEAVAELNFMMKMMLGNKIQEALDKVVDSLVDISEGRMPEGVDLSSLNNR